MTPVFRRPAHRCAAIAFFFSTVFVLSPAAQVQEFSHHTLPVPAGLTFTEGKFRVNEAMLVGGLGPVGSRARTAAVRFMERLAGRTGLFFRQDYLTALERPENSSVLFKSERAGDLRPGEDESYAVTISPDRILLAAPTDLGIVHGFETILQLLDADEDGYFVPCVQIDDRPRFVWRGLLLDSCRHFMPVDVVKRNLDGLAAVKMNVLHWHLTEDQGFRVESRVFPRLQEMGSDGLFYTQAQIRDIIQYASDRGIRVMPEFDIPGHSTSWFAAYPEYASGPGPYQVERKWVVGDPTFNPANPHVYAFLDKFFEEMAGLFPDPYVHIGGDENNGRQWDANPDIRRFKAEKKLPDNAALQAYFNRRIQQLLTKHGKKMMGWDEILQPDLPRDIAIQSWRGRESLYESARRGFSGLLSNGYYVDLCQSAEFHYLNDPLPDDAPLDEIQRRRILGGEATMWSELVTPETVDSRVWPRTAAIAERLWSPAGVRDVDDMYRRLDVLSVELEELGLTHLKNQDMMLRRLTGGRDIGPLKTLVDVVQPLQGYKRHNQGLTYTQLSPLTRLVDAAAPESRTARRFRRAVEEFLASPNPAAAEDLELLLRRWKDIPDALTPLIRESPVLAEIAPLSEALSTMAALALRALEALLSGAPGDQNWPEDLGKALDAARASKAPAELAVAAPVEKLVKAVLLKKGEAGRDRRGQY